MAGPTGEEGALQRVRSLSEMVLGFFEEERVSDGGADAGDTEDGSSSDDEGCRGGAEERRAFWESQHQLLQVKPPGVALVPGQPPF